MDYSTLVQNFIDRKVMRGQDYPARKYGNMQYKDDVLYSYSNPLVVRQKETGTYFLNSDLVSNTTGRHIRYAISGFNTAKIALIEVSGGALESILGYRNGSWSGRYFDEAINKIELIESGELANEIAKLPENSIYQFRREKSNNDHIYEYKYFNYNLKEVSSSPEIGMYMYNNRINLLCKRMHKYYTTPEQIAKNNFDSIPVIDTFITEMEDNGWEYYQTNFIHKSSALVFRSKHRQFESLFNVDNGYSNAIEHKNWYYYYGGFDERQYFIAALPREVTGIDDALESLKPKEVIAYQSTASPNDRPVLRQGEWFFVPAFWKKIPKANFTANKLPDDGQKTNEHVCKWCKIDGQIYMEDTTVFHRNRGGHSTGEHKKLRLVGQYMAYKNTELDSRSSMGRVD